MSRQQSAVMQQTAVTTVRTALQVPRPISLQSHNDHQNHPFVQNNAVMSTTSATETFDANDFITEFNILQGKKKPNSNDLLAQAVMLSGINGSDPSSHGHDVLAEAMESSEIT